MHTCNRIHGELANNHLSEKGLGTPTCMQDAFDVIWQSCSIGHGGNLADDQWLVSFLTHQLDNLTSAMKAMGFTAIKGKEFFFFVLPVSSRLDLSQVICLKLLI